MSQYDAVQIASYAHYDDQDDVLDRWLASLQVSEFEHLLSQLADERVDVLVAAAS